MRKIFELIRQLSIQAKRRITGLVTGEQRSLVRGGGIEFADYREYQPGDDIRQIDWSVFLRMRKLMVKLSAEEKELTLMIILDASRSMCFGQPEKFMAAKKIAAVLAGISLYGGNRAGILVMGSHLIEAVRPERSRASLARVASVISGISPEENINPEVCIRQFAARYGRRCMAVLISDLLFPEWPKIITGLSASGCEGYVLQTLAPVELDPPYLGEVTLVDVESMEEVPLHIQDEEDALYRYEMAEFLQEVRDDCHRNRLGYCLIPSDIPADQLFRFNLRKEGLLC